MYITCIKIRAELRCANLKLTENLYARIALNRKVWDCVKRLMMGIWWGFESLNLKSCLNTNLRTIKIFLRLKTSKTLTSITFDKIAFFIFFDFFSRHTKRYFPRLHIVFWNKSLHLRINLLIGLCFYHIKINWLFPDHPVEVKISKFCWGERSCTNFTIVFQVKFAKTGYFAWKTSNQSYVSNLSFNSTAQSHSVRTKNVYFFTLNDQTLVKPCTRFLSISSSQLLPFLFL